MRTRRNPKPADPAATPDTVLRFANLAGAEVHVIKRKPTPESLKDHRWVCTGCGTGGNADFYDSEPVEGARTRANEHAGQCRALPRTTA